MKKSVKSDMSDNHKLFAHQMFENCHVAAVYKVHCDEPKQKTEQQEL